MQYLLAVQVYDGIMDVPEDEFRATLTRTGEVTDAMKDAGVWVFVGGLGNQFTSTVVRPENGTTTLTDGPFAETKEYLGGLWIIDCADLDEALSWAKRCSLACGRPIEVRPFQTVSLD